MSAHDGAGAILLARHGETNDNLSPLRFQGFTDTPLNEHGRRQAAELADRVASDRIVSLWSSDLARARETAQIVGRRLVLEPRLDARLREGYRGRWEGRLFVEVAQDEPARYAAWQRAGEGFRFPGGESLRDQLDRVSAAVDDIRRAGELPALVVCHGGSIRRDPEPGRPTRAQCVSRVPGSERERGRAVSRLPVLAFGALVVATVAAFFVTQHLKVTTPLIAGAPAPDPAWINPLGGVTCGPPGRRVNHRVMRISFYLLHRSDDVDVEIIDPGGAVVATLATGVYMRGGAHPVRTLFTWDGREDDGQIAPDGVYYIRVTLLHQGRTVEIANSAGTAEPVIVRTVPPHPVVTDVSPSSIPRSGSASVTIDYAGNEGRGGTVRLYRTGLPGGPKLIKSFPTPWQGRSVVWNGTVRGARPAPQGTYLIGLDVTDGACNTGRFPAVMPPPAGTTPHAGVTVQYLGCLAAA